jgi:hypothetical protein
MPLDQLDQSGPTCQILAGPVCPVCPVCPVGPVAQLDHNMYYLIAGGQ